ncbi:hypothetical protein H4Q26_015656 [Puccinia striiformis f. sp. tritici PST-130]|nr:hypothetical protein H4Q26_015656 [Puccinia striiformis f. sp. tritici PST-130]
MAISLQLISLCALCLHYSSLTILMHLSRTGGQDSKSYRASAAVVMTELFKLIISLGFAYYHSFIKAELPTPRPSPQSRFEPQFESLPEEEEEEEEDQRQSTGNEQLDRVEENHRWKAEEPRWNEESDQLISDMISQIHSNSSKTRERTKSSEVYLPSQTGKRRRLTSWNGTTNPEESTVVGAAAAVSQSNVRPRSDHSHRMSVQASPLLTRLTQNHSSSLSPFRLQQALLHLRASVFSQDWYLLSIPAVMFVVQNNLQYLAASNLSVPLFQITYQLKILTTALCSVILLKRRLKRTQWVSLIILTAGVVIVQLNSSQEKAEPTGLNDTTRRQEMNQLLGLVAVVSACISSGFASVYLERMLKSTSTTGLKPSHNTRSPEISTTKENTSSSHTYSPVTGGLLKTVVPPSTSIWIRNIQLSGFGLLVSISIVLLENHAKTLIQVFFDSIKTLFTFTPTHYQKPFNKHQFIQSSFVSNINENSFFTGFSNLTWIVIFFQVSGGILNSAVMKYSNNINKNFSICLSIILSILFSNIFLSSSSNGNSHNNSNHNNNIFNFISLLVLLLLYFRLGYSTYKSNLI